MKRAPHISMTEKQFEHKKRLQFRAVLEALEQLRFGVHYLPQDVYLKFAEGAELLESAYKDYCAEKSHRRKSARQLQQQLINRAESAALHALDTNEKWTELFSEHIDKLWWKNVMGTSTRVA